jgi:hypothetical protein
LVPGDHAPNDIPPPSIDLLTCNKDFDGHAAYVVVAFVAGG